MKERDRRIAIFGSFGIVDRATVEEVKKINNKQEFLLSEYTTGITINTTFNGNHPTQQQSNIVVPMLKTEDNNMEVVFNENLIFVRENIARIEDYDSFRDIAINILVSIIDVAKIKPTRLACSGAFTDMIEARADEIFGKIFANGTLATIPSNEWELSVNDKKRNNELNCDINGVLSIVRGREVIGTEKNIPAGPIVVVYDYNTAPETMPSERDFSAEDIRSFVSAASEFRKKILEL